MNNRKLLLVTILAILVVMPIMNVAAYEGLPTILLDAPETVYAGETFTLDIELGCDIGMSSYKVTYYWDSEEIVLVDDFPLAGVTWYSKSIDLTLTPPWYYTNDDGVSYYAPRFFVTCNDTEERMVGENIMVKILKPVEDTSFLGLLGILGIVAVGAIIVTVVILKKRMNGNI